MGWTNPDTVHRASTGVVAPATWGDTVNDDLNFLYGDTGWTAPTLTNSWVNSGGTSSPAGFRKVGTRVELRGLIKSGTIGSAAFTLPSGYRPQFDCNIGVDSNGGLGLATISASAFTVTPSAGSNVAFSLDGISFDTI